MLVTVLMAVYNGEAYVAQAVESVLAQTFADFELIIVNDGSTDGTQQMLDRYHDSRMRVVANDQNLGLTRSLNKGIRLARGKYIARQDADDVSLPERLAHQVAYLENHSQVGLVGCASRWIDGQGRFLRTMEPPTEPEQVGALLLATIPFLHGTFMIRRESLQDIGGGYNERLPVAQYCELLLRLAERWDLANLPEVLYMHRRHDKSVTASRAEEQQKCLQQARVAAVRQRLRHGWGRLGWRKDKLPQWLRQAERPWLARRYLWWSAGARGLNRWWALQFLLIALLLDPGAPPNWRYLLGIGRRKVGALSAGCFLLRQENHE